MFAIFHSTRKSSVIAAIGISDAKQGRVSPVLNSSGIGTYPFQQLNSTCLSQEMVSVAYYRN